MKPYCGFSTSNPQASVILSAVLAFVYESKNGVERSLPTNVQLEAKSLVWKCCGGVVEKRTER